MRGVHAKNRITQNKRPLETRHQLFKHLWEWMVRAGVDPVTTERYQFRYRLKEVRSASTKLDALRKAGAQGRYWKNYDYKDALSRRLAGSNEGAYRMMHKIARKYYQLKSNRS